MRSRTLPLFALTAGLALALPDLWAGEGFKSGPAVGKLHGGVFLPYVVNGKKIKDRPHNVIVEFENKPVVALFIREGPESDEAAVRDLLKKVDEAVGRHEEAYLRGFAVFVTPDAHSSATQKKEDPDVLVAEAKARA